jgi:phosphoserine aminotransferase
MFSRPIGVTEMRPHLRGSQKNLGPAGIALVMIREDLAEQAERSLPVMLQYRTYIRNARSTTRPTFAIYMVGGSLKWILAGAASAMAGRNQAKAKVLYDYLDQSALFRGTVVRAVARS